MPIPTIPHVTKKRCPRCGGHLVVHHKIFSVFLGCIRYPNCDYTVSLVGSNSNPSAVYGKPLRDAGDIYEPDAIEYSLIDPNYD